MPDHFEDACDTVDAMVFSGDQLLDPENLKRFREYLARWGRGADEAEATIKEIENAKENPEE